MSAIDLGWPLLSPELRSDRTSPLDVALYTSLNTAHNEGNANTTKWRRQDPVRRCHRFFCATSMADLSVLQLPQTRLVARRRLVLPTRQLEDQHRHHGRRDDWNCRHGLELQCRERVQERDAKSTYLRGWRGGGTEADVLKSDRFFPSRWWSKQIIEHERAQKANASRES